MAPGGPGSPTSASYSLHHAIQQQTVIPRRLFRIPAEQRALLDRPDSWFSPSANTTKPLFNVPPGVLEDVKARILPPPAQKPLSSSASTQATSSKKRTADHDEPPNRPPSPSSSESSEEIPMSSWSLSPPRPMPAPSRSQKPVDDSDDSESSSSQAPPARQQPRTNTDAKKQRSPVALDKEHISNWQSGVILSQSPLPEPRDALRNLPPSSPGRDSSTYASVSQTQSQANTRPLSPLLQRTLGPLLPPSSSGPDELEAEIPGALFRATPPINKTSVPKGNFANTPPCGQGSVVPSTYAVAQSPPVQAQTRGRRPMKRIKFDEDDTPASVVPNTVKRTPGQGNSRSSRTLLNHTMSSPSGLISATFPNREPESAPSDKPGAAIPAPELCEEALPPQQPQIDAPRNAPTISEDSELAKFPPEVQNMETMEKGPTLVESNWAEIFWKEPLEAYRSAYDNFKGSLGDFVRACLSIKSLRRERKLPVFLYDDFIRVFCDDYIRYIERTDDDPPLYAMEWYVENIHQPLYMRGIVTNDNLNRVFEVHAKEYYEARKALGFSRSPTVDKSFTSTTRESPTTTKAVAPPSELAATKASTTPTGRDIAQAAPRLENSTRPLRDRPQAHRTVEQPVVQATEGRKTAGDTALVTVDLVDSDSDTSEDAMETSDDEPEHDSTTVAIGDGHQRLDRAANSTDTLPRPVEQQRQASQDTTSRPAATQDGRHPSKARHSMPVSDRITSGQSEHSRNPTPAKAKSRVLPPSFAPSTPRNNASRARRTTLPAGGTTLTDRPSPAGSAYSTLTAEGGVRKNKKKESRESRQERFRRHLQKLKEEGRLPGQAPSTAPPRH